jgi:hypothetical protein
MCDDTPLAFDLPAVERKKLTVDFDGDNQFNGRCLGLSRREIGEIQDLRVGDGVEHISH